MPQVKPLVRWFVLAALVWGPGFAGANETIQLADIRRTVETRDESGKTRKTEEPLRVDKQAEPDKEDTAVSGIGSAYSDAASGEGGSGAGIGFAGFGFDSERAFAPARDIELSYSFTNIFHRLTTRFESANFNNLSWNTVPDIDGKGAEIAMHVLDMGFLGLGVRGGFFSDDQIVNDQTEGSLFVREHVRTRGGWANLETATHPFWGVSLLAGVGGLTYSVKTRVETNAPVYRYEGLTGSRNVMIVGVGGRFEIPWSFPVRVGVGGRYWWTAGAGDPLETGATQFNAGLTCRF